MKIRKAIAKDLKEIAKVELSSGYHKNKFDVLSLIKELFDKNHKFFYIKENNTFAGYITLSKNGEIGLLAVSKKFQEI